MKLTKKQADFILKSKFGIIATANNNQPRACIAIPEKAEEDFVVFADVQMQKTNLNLIANKKVFVSFYDNDLRNCVKADGLADYLTNGNLFEEIKNKLFKQGLPVKAIVKIKLLNFFEGKEE